MAEAGRFLVIGIGSLIGLCLAVELLAWGRRIRRRRVCQPARWERRT